MSSNDQIFIFNGLSAAAHGFLLNMIYYSEEVQQKEIDLLLQDENASQYLDELISQDLVVVVDATWQVTEKAKHGTATFFGQMAFWERMVTASKKMTDEERNALHAWEREHLGKGEVGTSDWPGWKAVYARLSM